jgi:outer membrane protein OmpA-like peptidoglycan-associated protein
VSKGKILAITVVWLVLFGIAAVAWRYVVQPRREAVAAKDAEERVKQGTSPSRYDHRLDLALDSFSGYAVLRSSGFRDELAKQSIKINLHDDGADYRQRLNDLKSGKVQLAVFTIDALLKTCAQLGDLPGSIVAMIDETRGADAMVGYKKVFGSVDDLNRPDVKFVLTPDSPSETLANVVRANFTLDRLADDPFIAAADAEDVFKRYRVAHQDEPHVYVLWEPYVSKALDNTNVHVIVDSSRFRGYIVDVLVVNKDFLVKNRELIREVVECYFRANYRYRDEMVDLIYNDAKNQGQAISLKQAKSLVEGIWWKNTPENFAHFDVTDSLQHIEDIIANIADVLVKTSTIDNDPTGGQPNLLYYVDILRDLKAENFQPGEQAEAVRQETIRMASLSNREWETLTRVGTLDVPDLVFARGSSRLQSRDRAVLDRLAKTLEASRYYVTIRGNATSRGDLEANKRLAGQRAQAAADYLTSKGIDATRIRALGADPGGKTKVTITLEELPY